MTNPTEKVEMPGSKRKQAAVLVENIEWMAKKFGPDTIGFLTLTFADGVNENREANRRFNSVLNRLRERYRCGVVVVERHKSKAIHFHLVVATGVDIRSGIDHAAVFPARGSAGQGRRARGDYRTAPPALKAEWAWLREHLAAYGFGRHELQPMRGEPEALADYMGKYIGKSWNERTEDDKGARMVRYFGRWTDKEVNPVTGKSPAPRPHGQLASGRSPRKPGRGAPVASKSAPSQKRKGWL